MATIDWPSDRAFRPVGIRWGVQSPGSDWAAAYSGDTQSISHMNDRLTLSFSLPPSTSPVDKGRREAMLLALRTGRDLVRIGRPDRPTPVGDLRGSPVLAASALTGARSILIIGGYGTNLVRNPSFEAPTVTYWDSSPAGSHTGSKQFLAGFGNSLRLVNATAGQDSYFTQTLPCLPSTTYTMTAVVVVTSITAGALSNRSIVLRDTVATYSEDTTLSGAHPTSIATTKTLTITTAATASELEIRLYAPQGTVYWDQVQVTQSASAVPFLQSPTLLAGDLISVGSQLLQVGYAGSSHTADGYMLTPLAVGLRNAVTAGDAVTWNFPTGVFRVVGIEPEIEYGIGAVQMGPEVTLIEAGS